MSHCKNTPPASLLVDVEFRMYRIYIYDGYTMHLTLVLSFPCRVHRKLWPMIMMEMEGITLERRRMANESCPNSTLVVKDRESESWDEECDIPAAFLDHGSRKTVVKQLGDVTPLIHAVDVVTSTPITHPQRPTKLIDRRGKSLPLLPLNVRFRRSLLSAFNATV